MTLKKKTEKGQARGHTKEGEVKEKLIHPQEL